MKPKHLPPKSVARRPIRAEDLYDFEMVTACAISPNERQVAYTVESIDPDHRRYFTHLHVHTRSARSCRQYTFGEISDGQPVWSPDGASIAFVSTRNKKSGMYVISADGGAERKLIEMGGSFGTPRWSPDGKYLYFVFQQSDNAHITDEKKRAEQPLFRHITRFYYRADGSGFLPKASHQIWRIKINSGAAEQLTRGKLSHEQFALSPDGAKIFFLANDRRDPDRDMAWVSVFVMSSSWGAARKLTTPEGPKDGLVVSPDGKTLAWVGHIHPERGWGFDNAHIWTMPSSGAGKGRSAARDIMPKFDRHCEDQTIGDTGEVAHGSTMAFSRDSKRIFFLSSDTGNTHLFYVPARGGAPTRVTHDLMHIKGFSVNGACKTATIVMTNLSTTPELYTVPTVWKADRHLTKLTAVNDKSLSRARLGRTREVWFKSFDGIELQGWLTLPPDFSPRKRYPAILEVHGGPLAQYGNTFFHEMNFLAANGYVVMYTNPRGGNGRGETFAKAIHADWGSLDYRDVMSAADYLERLPYVNSKKVGITGGSYGGYMTNWVVGHTNRFAAAVTRRCVTELATMTGTSDIGWLFSTEFDGQPWERPENYRHMSPLTHIGKHVRTPLLIIHSEHDWRCNIEQAEQLYVKLKWLKKTVEMVRFPEESHGLSRHGRPDRRVANLYWVRNWFDLYLKGRKQPPTPDR